MALTQNDEIIEDMFPFDQASATPDKLRKVFRSFKKFQKIFLNEKSFLII